MKQILIKQGQVIIEEVPAPQIEPNTVLVEVHASCISVGTEMSGLKASGLPPWKRVLIQPQKLKKVIQMVRTQGISRTRSLIEGKLTVGVSTGYSAAGIVLEVGECIKDIRPGDRVACAGAQYAHHAEIIRVPRNLVVHIPKELDFNTASTVTLGAIALQGVRRAHPTIGETFVVIGLGVLGQLVLQILKANGCRVIGTDLDRTRITMAQDLGVDSGIHPDDGDDIEQIARLTDGIGADGVIITAATPSDAVVSKAFKICRKKGRVVLVGDVGLHLNRADFYEKELDFFISTSYGPGRYDNVYEEKGLDYPVAYVRWTENRNMMEYLNQVAEGKLRVDPLISATYPIDQAADAYASIQNSSSRPLMVLLSYSQNASAKTLRTIPNPQASSFLPGRIRIAVVGAGSFARSVHLPNMQLLSQHFSLRAIVSRRGHNAVAIARQFGADYSSTDYQEILDDHEVDAILIATRHDLHASMVLQALEAGKHVMVEKPLALNKEELDKIQAFFESHENPPVLMTGFNRRFSPYARRIHELVQNRSNPMILNYRMNAGYIPPHHWVHTEEGGGRNRGEACHIYDLFTYFTDSRVIDTHTKTIIPQTDYYSHNDNFSTSISFEDGSIATLIYTSLGNADYPKEQLEIFCDGKIFVLQNYESLSVFGTKTQDKQNRKIQKGHMEELKAFALAMQNTGEWPIPLWQQIQATAISFSVEKQLNACNG